VDYIQKIEDYYTTSHWVYRWFCFTRKSLGIHYGFWNKKTKNRHQAMINQNQAVVEAGKITANDKVLDAGCGVGGTAIYIAKKARAKAIGISITAKQIKLAKKYARDNGVVELTDFQIQDYTKTNFADNSFDVIYGVESICYASPKLLFLKEAYRLLKPGGRLVVTDGYLKRQPKTAAERRAVRELKQAFVLKEFITPEEMGEQIKQAGFKIIKDVSRIETVKPSVDYFYKQGRRASRLVKLLEWTRLPFLSQLKRNSVAVIRFREGVYGGFMTYWLHVAEK